MSSFITIEGGEYTGKTTVAAPGLRDVLKAAGYDVLLSREPGGTPESEEIRQRIFARLREGAQPQELAVLFNEARQIHLEYLIRPFVAQHPDGIVLLDRFCDTTLVYQGMEAGVPIPELLKLHENYADNTFPDLTIILQFPEDRFDATLKLRQMAESDADGRDKTLWDSAEAAVHKQRQAYYMELPQLYADMGIDRTFLFADASGHPYSTISQTVEAAQTILQPSAEREPLIPTYEMLRDKGQWIHHHELWLDLKWRDQEAHLGRLAGARK